MTDKQRAQLRVLEARQTEFLFRLHQIRLMTSALRREIRLARKALVEHNRFERIEKIRIYSDAVSEWTHELRS